MADTKEKLQDKVAIVTGGASGIGEATASLFADHGARIVIADIQDEKGRNLVKSIGPHRCAFIHCDVTDEQQVKSLIETTIQTYGRLDIMFCNAGVLSQFNQGVLDFDVAACTKLFAINVQGTAACMKHAARAMVDGNIGGSIICTASIVATIGTDKSTDYTMSKHAVLGLVRSASMQLGEYGIRVNCVSPGPVATPMLCNLLGKGIEETEKNMEPRFCLRGSLKVKHVADAVLFLACEDSEFFTGQNLVVDGGFN
ncbi:short-chain dehydrogenase reductase 3b-like [Tripterygium wilfordii]|uniref:Short-chain dehydrogenase reductase 3b-like n=1 Tax=Tripterygium wilfordii TaxID=458696 RepID=A0A7J7C7P3_TRIWF|nr:(-)-isopiperitenol/(-)-carveol dehydrogenase, mitochondrial-like [Tripterygium wilfordii]KAF5730132.1 short-chain dehydrogenase reductase 3b-like [Tripterygium wilfordii]